MNAYLPETINNYCFTERVIEKEQKKVLFQVYIRMHFYNIVRLHQFFLILDFKFLI